MGVILTAAALALIAWAADRFGSKPKAKARPKTKSKTRNKKRRKK